MRRFSLLALLILAAFILMACDEDGELRIRNRTNAPIQVAINNTEPLSIEAGSGVSRFYSESTTVSIEYAGIYVFPQTVSRTVSPGLPTTVNINANAGAITIENNDSLAVNEVYISPPHEPNWGANQIAADLIPNAKKTWSVSEGTWDIKIVLDNGTARYCMRQSVAINSTLNLKTKDFLAFADKSKAAGAFQFSNYRIAR